MSYKVRERVSIVINDNGTCLAPGIVTHVDEDGINVLVHKATGFEVIRQSHGNARDYVGTPMEDTARRWDQSGMYARLEDKASNDYIPRRPLGGDAVRLVTPWKWGDLETGAIGVIDGFTNQTSENVSITFNNPSIHRARGIGGVIQCSGGPGTVATPVEELQPTTDYIELSVWDFKDGRRKAHNAEYYRVTVPVWEWSPTQ